MRRGKVILLEDFTPDDGEPYYSSAYSLLSEVLEGFEQHLERTFLTHSIVSRIQRRVLRRPVYPVSWRAGKRLSTFLRDPFGTLELLGCQIGAKRRIRTLYRVRSAGSERRSIGKVESVFGYASLLPRRL